MRPHFRILEHTADVGLEASGDTPASMFEQAAAALLWVAVDDRHIDTRSRVPLDVEAPDYPSLLVNFLDEILYLFDTGRFAPRSCEVTAISPTRVAATLVGEPRDPERHPWKLIVKAVTYHGLEVSEHDGAWLGRAFLDV